MKSAAIEPQKMEIANLVTDESRSFMYNPSELQEKVSANYSELVVLGLSHPVQHFTHTSAVTFTFDLFFHSTGKSRDVQQAILRDRLFLKALTHPWRSSSIARGGPPRVLFLWPNLLSLTCNVRDVAFTYTQFNPKMEPVSFKASLTIAEIRDAFVGMDDILNSGDDRGGNGTPPATDGGDL